MKKCFITFLFVVLSFFCFANFEEVGDYNSVYRYFNSLSTEKVMEKGSKLYENKKYDTALVCFSIVCGRYDRGMTLDQKKIVADAFNGQGVIYYNYYSYVKSLEMLIKGMEISENSNYDNCLAKVYNNIGNVYFVFEDYENANRYYEKSYKMFVKLKDVYHQAFSLFNLVNVTRKLNLNDKAKFYIIEYGKLDIGENSAFKHSNILNLGYISLQENKLDSALYFFDKSLKIDNLDYNRICSSLSNIANVYFLQKKYDIAKSYIEQSIKLASEHRLLNTLSKNYMVLSDIYKSKGDYKMAMQYQSEYLKIHDSVFNTIEYGKVKEMPFLHEIEKIANQMQKLNVEQQIKDNKIYMQQIVLCVFIGGFVIIFVLLLLLYKQKKRLSHSYRDLFNRNIEIVNSEKLYKRLQQDYVSKIELKDTRIEELEKYVEILKEKYFDQDSVVYNVNDNKNEADSKVKYSASPLNNEQKMLLAEQIVGIVENKEIFSNPDFNLDRLVEMTGSNSRYISQIINEIYGKNFNSFINEYRIKEARKLLTDPNYAKLTIEAISMKVGFKSKASFNVTFKKITGITPSQYQQMAHNMFRSTEYVEMS